MRRLKYSPAQSPYLEPVDRRDSYFPNGQNSQSRLSRRSSQDEEQAKIAAYRRRSSVPDLPMPLPAGAERASHWDSSKGKDRKARSHSATRPVQHSRQRSHTASTPDGTAPRHTDSPSRRHRSNPSLQQSQAHSRPSSQQQQSHPHSRPSSQQQHSHHRQRLSTGRPKSPSTVDESSGSEASSETSHNGRSSRQRRSDEERKSRTNLWVPSFLRTSNKRRHSSDTGVRKIEAAKSPVPSPAPLRPEYYGPKRQHMAPAMVAPGAAQPVMPVHSHRQSTQANPGVRFRNDMFNGDPSHAAPESPAGQPVIPPNGANGLPPPAIRYPEPQPHHAYLTQQMEDMSMATQTASRESSIGSGTDRRYQSGSDWDRNRARKAGQPLRVSTVTGVGGRTYPEPNSAERHTPRVRGSVPTTVV